MTTEDEIRAVFHEAGATGFVHAREIGGTSGAAGAGTPGAEVTVEADAPVVLASTFKIPVAVAFERAVSAGDINSDERTTVTARYRRGGVGLAGLCDDAVLATQPPERLHALSVLDPARTTASTPRNMTILIEAIWADRATPPEACARVRTTMAHQVWPHRVRSGFPGEVQVAAKTGTLPATRNEVGAHNLPDVDRAIGTAARLAVDALRDGR